MSTSAFLQTILAKRRPIPLMEVRANMIFCFPSTFVLSTRSMCWNSSFATKDWHRQIKKHVNQTWERERKRYRSRHRLNHSPWLGFQMKLCEAVRLRRLQSAEKSKETETLDSQWRFKTFIYFGENYKTRPCSSFISDWFLSLWKSQLWPTGLHSCKLGQTKPLWDLRLHKFLHLIWY